MTLFFELLQISVGNRELFSTVPTIKEWVFIFKESQRQALLGVLLCGIERLPEEQRPPKEILLSWIGLVLQIESRNSHLMNVCSRFCKTLEKDGFHVCILKGQANHAYYPKGCASRRSCGDIDAWVVANGGKKQSVKAVMAYLQSHYKMTGLCWLHASMQNEDDVPIEVHFRPSFMNAPLRNRRFLRHFRNIDNCSCLKEFEDNLLPTLKIDEDLVYQMNHIYRHLLDEGVGLRQIIDYYYLLLSWNNQHIRSREDAMKIVSGLGMKRFAGALMFVLHEVCGLSEGLLLCPAIKSDGKFLLNEIMLAGNFGHSDPRKASIHGSNGTLRFQISRAWRRIRRNLKFLSSYPEEVIWEPFARMYHFMWKKCKLWKI